MKLNPIAENAWDALMKVSKQPIQIEDFFDIFRAIKKCNEMESFVASPSSEGRSSCPIKRKYHEFL